MELGLPVGCVALRSNYQIRDSVSATTSVIDFVDTLVSDNHWNITISVQEQQ